jgi:hypothetical protein
VRAAAAGGGVGSGVAVALLHLEQRLFVGGVGGQVV